VLSVGLLGPISLFGSAFAANPPQGDFNLQVTPSPLVATVTPGLKSTEQIKIRNGSTASEQLKIEPRAFNFNSATGKVDLQDTVTPPIAAWISFSAQKFTVQPGQWFTEDVIFNVPKDAGFSYSFALVISRQFNPKPQGGSRAINGSLAIFSLINVDRPGAKSSLKIVSFTSTRHLYEYLPATLNIRFHNTGNTIVQPYGNLFLQHSASSKSPLATLPVNGTRGYILPGTERTITASWNDGFATYKTVQQPNDNPKQKLQLDWSKLSHFRIGRYTAKLIAVYSDGSHDVPIEGTVTFWVVPWRAILVFIAVAVGLWFLGRWRNKRRTEKAVKRALAAQAAATKAAANTSKPKAEEKQP